MNRPRTGFPFLDAGFEQEGSVLAFAHRGGSFHPGLEGLENTVTAFQHAVDLGYRYLETDVNVTKDGVLLAFHDAVLDRVTDRTGSLADLTAAEVAGALVGSRESIPTVDSLLDRFPETMFNIDVKSDDAVEPLARLLTARRASSRLCVGSFSQRRIQRFRALVGPTVATAAAPREVALFRLLPWSGLQRFLARSPAAALQIPRRRGPLELVTPDLVRRVHALARHVHVWTVDEPAEMHDLLDMGVDGLVSDRTDWLKAVLVERGQWMGS